MKYTVLKIEEPHGKVRGQQLKKLSDVSYEIELGGHLSIYHVNDIRPRPTGNPPVPDPEESDSTSNYEISDTHSDSPSEEKQPETDEDGFTDQICLKDDINLSREPNKGIPTEDSCSSSSEAPGINLVETYHLRRSPRITL